jgi:hypothetical protein
MRRTACILASVTTAAVVALGFVSVQPASAHFCSMPVENVAVGKDVLINVGVAAEDKPVREVDVDIPEGFVASEAIGFLGYTGTIVGNVAHFEGAEFQPYTCGYFSLAGHATRRGRLIATITTHAADGTVTRYRDPHTISRFPAQVIYVGMTEADYQRRVGGSPAASKSSPVTAVAIGVGAGAVAVAVAYLWNRRRALP